MSFQSILDEKRENEGGYVPFVLSQIRDADNNRIENRIPELGDEAIDFSLPNEDGSEVRLSELLNNGPVILNFFRGNFCEFCQLQLKALQRSYHEFQRYNATLVGISPSFVSVKKPVDKNPTPYSYSILTDIGNKVAAAFGLRYKISEELENMLMIMGVGATDFQNMFDEDGEKTLTIPATFVVRRDRKIIFKFSDTDYTKRAEPADIIASLISISEQ